MKEPFEAAPDNIQQHNISRGGFVLGSHSSRMPGQLRHFDLLVLSEVRFSIIGELTHAAAFWLPTLTDQGPLKGPNINYSMNLSHVQGKH